MDAKTLIASVSLALFSLAGHASDATQFATEASTLSRAEVQAELARANAAGELARPGETYGTVTVADLRANGARLSRAAVVAELQRARADGSLDHTGDTYGTFRATELASTLTRAEVRAQVRNGGLSRGNYTNYAGG